MSFNTFGKQFRFTTWGESHGPAIGCIVDGCPPNIYLKEQDIQKELDKRKPGQSKFTTQRKEDDKVQILSGVFEGKTTGTPIYLDQVTLTLLISKNMGLETTEEEDGLLLEKLLHGLQLVQLQN
jgi:hypothetical protein